MLAFLVSGCQFPALVAHDASDSGDDGSVADGSHDATDDGGAICAATGMPTGVSTETITVDGVSRTYLQVVPATYDPKRRYPLIYAPVPALQTAESTRTQYDLDTVVLENAIVVYPTKPETFWDVSLTASSFKLYDEIQSAVRSKYCIGKTYAFGFSDAGYYANSLGCYRGGSSPSDVAGVIAVNATFAGSTTDCIRPGISAAIVHNMDDQTVLISNGMASRDLWKTKASCAVTSPAVAGLPCFSYDQCAPPLHVLWCPTNLAGHTFPSVSAAIASQLIGL